jgi:hypothetical protein
MHIGGRGITIITIITIVTIVSIIIVTIFTIIIIIIGGGSGGLHLGEGAGPRLLVVDQRWERRRIRHAPNDCVVPHQQHSTHSATQRQPREGAADISSSGNRQLESAVARSQPLSELTVAVDLVQSFHAGARVVGEALRHRPLRGGQHGAAAVLRANALQQHLLTQCRARNASGTATQSTRRKARK